MNKIFLILASSFLFFSCQLVTQGIDIGQDVYNTAQFSEVSVFKSSFPAITTQEDVCPWIKKMVTYRKSGDSAFPSPKQTLLLGYGDCKAFSTLYMDIMYVKFGIKTELCLVDSDENRSIEAGGKINHAIVRLPSGKLINPQSGEMVHYTVKFSYSFDTVFNQ
jgi:hypothetical protein